MGEVCNNGAAVNKPKPDNLRRMVNRSRQATRPKEPKDLTFEIDANYLNLEGFLVGDVRVDNQRHLLFATETQRDLLKRSKRWFVDGTFKVVSKPFTQLMSVHAFLVKDGVMKQVPLMFVLMSRRSKEDYIAVFQKIKEAVGDPDVEGFVLDFEAAAWTALRQVFPGIPIKGCVFHWTQAVWRKVQDLGLRTAYCQREADYLYIKKLLALPFLPHSHIEEAFNQLATMARSEQMKALCSYIETTWMESPVWNVRSWSIFKQEVRTNNDVEGYHNRLNQKAGKANLTFYVLVPLLRAESDLVTLQMTLVQENLLTRRHRREYAELQNQLDVLWEEYSVKLITTSELLKRCGKIYGPTD